METFFPHLNYTISVFSFQIMFIQLNVGVITCSLLLSHQLFGFQIQLCQPYIRWKCWEMLKQRLNHFLEWHWKVESRLASCDALKLYPNMHISGIVIFMYLKFASFRRSSCSWIFLAVEILFFFLVNAIEIVLYFNVFSIWDYLNENSIYEYGSMDLFSWIYF